MIVLPYHIAITGNHSPVKLPALVGTSKLLDLTNVFIRKFTDIYGMDAGRLRCLLQDTVKGNTEILMASQFV